MNIPAPENLSYLPYQLEGIEFALARPSTLIGDEMGLGKTIQAIGVMNGDETLKSVLIVCPASLKLNWERELEKWLVHDRTIGIAQGHKFFPDTEIVIINYAIVSAHKHNLRSRQWDLIVMDEAQALKNKKSARTRAIFGGNKAPKKPVEARKKIALSGTPIKNKPKELWTLLNYLERGLFGNWRTYTRRYCDAFMETVYRPGIGRSRVENVEGSSNEAELQDRLRETLMIRRMKKQVLTQLPEITHQTLALDIGAKALFREEKRIFRLAMRGRDVAELPYEEMMANLQEQRDLWDKLSEVREQLAERKIAATIEHIRTLQDGGADKIVVFAHRRMVIEKLAEAFGDEARFIYGATPNKERQEIVDGFQNDPSIKIFIGQYTAAGTGLTLTAANIVVLAELTYVPADIAQAIARAHRIGQKHPVLAQYLAGKDSIDMEIIPRLVEKQKVIGKCLDDRQNYAPVEGAARPFVHNTTTTISKGDNKMTEYIERFFSLLERIAVATETAAENAKPKPRTRKTTKKVEPEAADAATPDAAAEKPAAKAAEKPAAPAAKAPSLEELRESANTLLEKYKETDPDGARNRVLGLISEAYPKFGGSVAGVPAKAWPAILAKINEALAAPAEEPTDEAF